jgi:tetratricopeptide (TPR) repeat protein
VIACSLQDRPFDVRTPREDWMKDPDDLYMEGLDRFAEEDYPGAVEWFEKALAVDPEYIDAYHGIARACFEARVTRPELLDKAIAAAIRATELDPDDVTAYSTLSQCYVFKGDKDTAEEWGAKARVAGWKQQIVRDKKKREKRDPGQAGTLGMKRT